MGFFDVISLGEGVSKNVVPCLVEDVSRSFKMFQTVKKVHTFWGGTVFAMVLKRFHERRWL